MEALKKMQKRYCSTAIVVAVLIASVFIGIDMVPIGKGLILGALFSIINFILMGRALPGRILEKKKAAVQKSLGSVLFRFAIMAIPLYIGIKGAEFNFFAVSAGLFFVQIMILGDHLIVAPLFGKQPQN